MNRANKSRVAVEAKRKELIELFINMGHNEQEVSGLTLAELQEIYRSGIRK